MPTYKGIPIRERVKRPAIPRSIRNANRAAMQENKENLLSRTSNLYENLHVGINNIADETGAPRSVVARMAYNNGKAEIRTRAPNAKNAWVQVRMREVNEGGFQTIS
jgi:hypothetical protein